MALAQYLHQTVSHYPRTSYDGYGRETETTATDYLARVVLMTKRLMLPNGEFMTVDASCVVLDDPAIAIDDRIDYLGVKYRVHGIKKAVDGQGNVHHITMQLVKWVN